MERREFIKQGSVAAAGLAILPSGTLFAANKDKVKLGYIGVGLRGRCGLCEPDRVRRSGSAWPSGGIAGIYRRVGLGLAARFCACSAGGFILRCGRGRIRGESLTGTRQQQQSGRRADSLKTHVFPLEKSVPGLRVGMLFRA